MLRRTGFKRPERVRPPMGPLTPITRGVVSRCDEMAPVQPKDPHMENPHLLAMARGKPCLLLSPICQGDTDTTVACHGAGVANGKGMGYKVSDFLSCWGCHACNHYTDAYGGATKEQKQAVFAAGHARQVIEWQRIVGDMSNTPKDRQAAHWALCLLEAINSGAKAND